MKFLIHCFICFLIINVGWSQPVASFYKHFDSKDGLSDDHVTAIIKDNQGFLWVGTANGLNRYDGYNFKVYLPDFKRLGSSISNEYICDIVQDKYGYIWIGTNDGLNRYDPKTENFKLFKNSDKDKGSLPNSLIRDLYLDDSDDLYIVCDNRDLAQYDESTGEFKTYAWKEALVKAIPEARDESYKAIYSLQKHGENKIYLNTKYGRWSFNTKTKNFQLINKAITSPEAIFNYQNKVWNINSGIISINSNESIPIYPLSANIQSFHVDYRNALWLGGDNGLWLCEPAFQHFLFKEIDGQTKGLYKIINSQKGNYQYALNSSRDQLLIFQQNKLIKSINLGGQTFLLYEDKTGKIWTSGDNKLFYLNFNDHKLNEFKISNKILPVDRTCIFCDMAETENGNLWFANDYNGILVHKAKENKWWIPQNDDDFPTTNVAQLLSDPERKTIWIGSNDYGLFKYDITKNKFELYRPDDLDLKHSIGAYVISALAKDSLGNIWVGTDHGGVSKFNYKNSNATAITTFSMDSGLPSNQIFSLICDPQGDIWAATSKGLAMINSINNKITSFGKEEGLKEEMLINPIEDGGKGVINYSIKNGIQYFQSQNLKISRQSSKIFFNSFKLFDKIYPDSININYVNEIILNYKQNYFSFEIATDDISNPKKNQFAYVLEGYEKQWNFLKNSHSGSYTNVPPGEYILLIKGGKEGNWDSPGIQLHIIIQPPFWGTWWFRTLAGLLFLGLIIIVYRVRINKIRKDEATKTAFNKRIAQTEMTALRAQMNPHFVFNCLSSINHFILANRADDASAYLTKFSRLIRLILDNSRKETNDLKRELETLQLYIEMEQMRFADRFHYTLKIESGINTEDIQIPPMLIQPYVENAIWHGLMHKKTTGNLLIEIKNTENVLTIIIEDDGIGRVEAAELKSKTASKNKSHGMEVTAERIQLINQLYNANASVDIIDKTNENGTMAGTKVVIKINNN